MKAGACLLILLLYCYYNFGKLFLSGDSVFNSKMGRLLQVVSHSYILIHGLRNSRSCSCLFTVKQPDLRPPNCSNLQKFTWGISRKA